MELCDLNEKANPNYNNNILENVLTTALNKNIPIIKSNFISTNIKWHLG